jgi:hypothetical protein
VARMRAAAERARSAREERATEVGAMQRKD